MRADHHELPTPRTTLRTGYVRVLVWCKSCRHRRDADLQALVDAGKGDVPLIHLRFRCSNCASRLTDFLVTSRAEVRPLHRRGKRGSVCSVLEVAATL